MACEFSGTVRRAFDNFGHDAWSCDLIPSEDNSPKHVQGDARTLLNQDWDLMIAHPPCTRLCVAGVHWLARRNLWSELDEAANLFSDFWNAPIPRIAVENPVMHCHAKERITNYEPFAQTVQPWQYGHGETKRTCLWLRSLPPLVPTDVVEGREQRIYMMGETKDRARERSRFYPGIAAAMAEQWGSL